MVGKMEGPREVGRSMNFWSKRIGGGSRDEEVGNWGRRNQEIGRIRGRTVETGVGEEERNGTGIGMMEERVKSGEEENRNIGIMTAKEGGEWFSSGGERKDCGRWSGEERTCAVSRGVEEEVETRVRMENLDFR